MKYVLIGAVFLWIAYDVGSGVLMGLSKARHEQLASMPMAELLRTVAETHKDKVGREWISNAVLTDSSVRDYKLVQSVKLTRLTREKFEAKWAKGTRSTIKRNLVWKTCRDDQLLLVLERGATVLYRISDKNDHSVTRIAVRETDCT